MFPDDELVMVSALEHWSYCARQRGLIHLKCVFYRKSRLTRNR